MRRGGFTLLELLVVLSIAAVMIAVVPPLISSALPGARLKATAREMAAGLRVARTRALTRRAETSLLFDLDRRRYGLAGQPLRHRIPEGIEVKLLTAESELQGGRRGGIRFFPEGGSTGGRVTLTSGRRALGVDVDWLTGRIRILTLEPGA